MDFQEFLQFVPKILDVDLPAKEAHFKMVPEGRRESMENLNFDNLYPKTAAVMMLFYPKNKRTHLVLIVRNTYEGVHSAQIAFPGGKNEAEDVSFEHTAVRETEEEIGIHHSKIKVIRPFSQLYIQPSNFMVYPFLGICLEEIVFVPDVSEVANIIELPLIDFLNDNLLVTANMSTSYSNNMKVPAFKIQEYIVWGATAMMLNELKEVLKKVF